jgi:hypothetical protein
LASASLAIPSFLAAFITLGLMETFFIAEDKEVSAASCLGFERFVAFGSSC